MTALDDARARRPPPRLDHVEVWVFDLDNTLYPARLNLFPQVERRMGEFISNYLGVGEDEAGRVRKAMFREHGSTLRGLMDAYGLDPVEFLDYIHDVDLTAVPPDAGLNAALGKLDGRKLIFTSASLEHAERVTKRLGVHHHFEDVYHIAAAGYLPKPHPPTYDRFIERHRVDPRAAAMFEDSARNLKPAAALGMITVWVPGLSEWSREDSEGDHIHHVAEDLTAWLTQLTAG